MLKGKVDQHEIVFPSTYHKLIFRDIHFGSYRPGVTITDLPQNGGSPAQMDGVLLVTLDDMVGLSAKFQLCAIFCHVQTIFTLIPVYYSAGI